MIAYHITPQKTYKKHIKREGLIPNIGPRSKIISEPEDRIYFFRDLDAVDDALMNWMGNVLEDEGVSDVAVLKVDLSGYDVEKTFYEDSWEIYVTQPIPPDRISLVRYEPLDESYIPTLQEVFLPSPTGSIKAPKILPEKNVAPRTNYEDEWNHYNKYGIWWEDVLEYIPISKINIPPVWNQHRYADNKQWLEKTGQFPPIRVSYDEDKDQYEIGDGIHRTNVARDMGYTHIPALASYQRNTPPPAKPDASLLDMENEMKNMVDMLDVLPDNFYFGRMSTHISDQYITLTVGVIDTRQNGFSINNVHHVLTVQFDKDGHEHGVFLHDADKNKIDERMFEATGEDFIEQASKEVEAIYAENKSLFRREQMT